MSALIRCVCIFVVEQLREPIGIFWSFVAPIAYIVLTSMSQEGFYLPAQAYVQKAAWCLAYVALIVACMGFGLYLVGRRESGFVRSFLNSPARRKRFLLAQYLASMVMASAYGIAFVMVTSWALSDIDFVSIVALLGRYLITVACFMFAAIFFAALPLTFQSTSSVMTVVMTIVVVAGFVTQSPGSTVISPWVVYSNPFSAAAHFMAASIPDAIVFWVLAAQILLLGLLGVYGFCRMRINPEWSNR